VTLLAFARSARKFETMRVKTAAWISVTVAVAALATSLPAHAFRCGTRVITRGDHASKLLEFCGEPDAVQTRLAQRPFVSRDVRGHVYLPGFAEDVWVEEWTYNLGPNKLMRLVRMENGFVAEIRHLGYGYPLHR
jgi:hypothetical protein